MKITLHEGLGLSEPEIEIRCHIADPRLRRLLDYIRQYSFHWKGGSERLPSICIPRRLSMWTPLTGAHSSTAEKRVRKP